jgi:hypothetical protein
METCPGEANGVLAGVRSPPLQGASQGEMALLGEAENHGEDGFLKEAHSVRPRGTASGMPRNFIAPRLQARGLLLSQCLACPRPKLPTLPPQNLRVTVRLCLCPSFPLSKDLALAIPQFRNGARKRGSRERNYRN